MWSIHEARALLWHRDELDARGWSGRRVSSAVAGGILARIHPGWYVQREEWDRARAEERHLLCVLAVAASRSEERGVYSHAAASVLHGLPMLGAPPERVDVSGERLSGHVHRDSRIARHECSVPDEDIVVIDGIRCTSLARTVADLARLARPSRAVAIADAAFARRAWRPRARRYDDDAHQGFAAEVRERLERVRAARGVRQGREVVEIADGRAESPGESLHRLQLFRLGFRRIRLQVAVPGPGTSRYWLDASLDEIDTWAESDGDQKYTDPLLRGDRSIDDVVLEEKRREDWIRATTGRRLVRSRFADLRTTEVFGRHLAARRVVPPGPGPRAGILRATR